MINTKKLLPIIILCLFTFQCEQGWLKNIIDPTVLGCNVDTACNYDPDVNENDGTCEFLSCKDCLGYPHGIAVLDSCGTCDASLLNDCTQDCFSTWGGTAYLDGCEDCVGGNTGLTSCTTGTDCAGVLGGTSYADNCETCDADSSNDCTQDCNGTWGGSAILDNCGVCGGDNSDCIDCAGVVGGTATVDECGTCDSDASNDCESDCFGVLGGSAVEDECGVCGGDGSIAGDGYMLLWDECYNIEETTELNYNNNEATGAIPSEIGNLVNLTHLDLSSKTLTGNIPSEIGNLTNLTFLDLGQNELTGEIPSSIGNLINLIFLELGVNALSGNIPVSIGNLTNLTYLELYRNQLTGEIPSEISNLSNLDFLFLSDNQLSGQISESICNLSIDWSGVTEWGEDYLQISNNQLCPPYPSCITEEDIGTQDISACPAQDCAGTWGGTNFDANSDGFCDEWVDLTVTDVDGNSYETVQIGVQLWMQENLKVTKYKDGSEIPIGYSNSEWVNLSTGAYAVYEDDPANADVYGNLYNWYVVDDDRGVCPDGWNVPTDAEYSILADYLGGSDVAGGKMKSTGTIEEGDGLWYSPNIAATNESGFTAYPGGYRHISDGLYYHLGNTGNYWSSTKEPDTDFVFYRVLFWDYSYVHNIAHTKNYGFSVRCIND